MISVMLVRQWTMGYFDLAGLMALIQDPVAVEVIIIAGLVGSYILRKKPALYCLDNVVFEPPKDWQVSHEDLLTIMQAQGRFDEDSMGFLRRLLERSGTGDSTHW